MFALRMDDVEEIRTRQRSGITLAQQAAEREWNYNTFRRELREVETGKRRDNIIHLPPALTEDYSAYPVYHQDECIIAGDLHTNTQNNLLIARMCDFADLHLQPPRMLFLVGDAWNGEADSEFDRNGDEISRAAEFSAMADIFHYLLETFAYIVMTPGNHLRKRFMRKVEGDIHPWQIVRLVTKGDDYKRVELLKHDIVEIRSGGIRWTATHQYQYSKSKLVVADKLAQRYQTNIVTFHQHHSAVGRDMYDRYTIIDCGGLHNAQLMAYLHLVPSSKNVPNTGFVYLKDGCAQLLTPYRTMTQWGLWGMEDVA